VFVVQQVMVMMMMIMVVFCNGNDRIPLMRLNAIGSCASDALPITQLLILM